jgi:membrane protein DedA with SNARE-associated domain
VLLSHDELERGHRWFERYGDWVVLVTRLLPAVRSFIAFPAGVVRMPFWRFLLFSAVGSAIWCSVLGVVGFELGKHWKSVSGSLRGWDVVLVLILVALIAFAVYKRLHSTRRRGEEAAIPRDYTEPGQKVSP